MPKQITPKLLSWTTEQDDKVYDQAKATADLPIIYDHVSLMPDAHFGYGAPVGSVVATEGTVIPSAVGVDIGCGMMAARLNLTSHDLPDNLGTWMQIVRNTVPAGVGIGHARGTNESDWWFDKMGLTKSLEEDGKLLDTARKQFGSLGSGNHFYEICLDENDNVWVVLHSGSRGVGNVLANRHIDALKARWDGPVLEDPNLAWLDQGTPEFDDYIADMLWAQSYAMGNRQAMMLASLRQLRATIDFPEGVEFVDEFINCHHNFCQQEVHGGKELWITRKGAIRASAGYKGVIPGSMGASTFIITGKGEPLSWESCSHGAGRLMGRNEARRQISVEDFKESMGDRVWQDRDAEALLDEAPGAYKNIDEVMAAQADLVSIDATLHQVLNYKGANDKWKRAKL